MTTDIQRRFSIKRRTARKAAAMLLIPLLAMAAPAQEALKSTEEEYYDFLSLTGGTERPTLIYRTLSDSVWEVGGGEKAVHPWQGVNLGRRRVLWQPETLSESAFLRGVNQDIALKIYGPDWFNSFNTAAPYGQNDGALWQGKGYNTSLSGGARLEAYGVELTVKPQVSFSQNRSFDYISPNYTSGKAAEYGYYGVRSVDAPQRFGNSPFFTFDWGDTEIRYTWHTLTVGFGTQAIWLGPAQLNPIIHSNNAPTYPKLDIGLRRQAIITPKRGWHLGDIELRAWWGRLSESDYFDSDSGNDHNLISGFSAAWSLPSIFSGLTLGINRTMLSKWDDIGAYSLFTMFVPKLDMHAGRDSNDQRFSFTVDYLIPKAGLELYLEWARNDYTPETRLFVMYPFHTEAWTFGTAKAFNLTEKYGLKLLLEVTFLETSADYDRLIPWTTTFYSHHIITQGYTNRGQWLGAGIGTGGNSQYLGITFYHPKGSVTLFGRRCNPDLDYTMYIDSKKDNGYAEKNVRAFLDFGISADYFATANLLLSCNYTLSAEFNPLNKAKESGGAAMRYNNHVQLNIKYNF